MEGLVVGVATSFLSRQLMLSRLERVLPLIHALLLGESRLLFNGVLLVLDSRDSGMAGGDICAGEVLSRALIKGRVRVARDL